MDYINNILAVSSIELIRWQGNPEGLFPKSTCQRWDLEIVKSGKGFGNNTYYSYSSIPERYKAIVDKALTKPAEPTQANGFIGNVTPDAKAMNYYSTYLLADGRNLPADVQREYCNNAAVLNALQNVYDACVNARAKHGKKINDRAKKGEKPLDFWNRMLATLEDLRFHPTKGHTLPKNLRKLQYAYLAYIGAKPKAKMNTTGYESIISGKWCNDNSRKVSTNIERLLMALYRMPNKPFTNTVHTTYMDFINNGIEIVDKKTGECFNPADFMKKGKAIEISAATVWSYLNTPENRPVVDSLRNGAKEYNDLHRPHHHRNAPVYSFSKISMDDRDLPRKCVNGRRVKAYYAYDVASGAVVGFSYSMDKDELLFLDCMQNMFRFLNAQNIGMPMEVEVENHLVNKFFDDLAVMFPFVRICKPGNSQEKHAEHFNKAKKYGTEKTTQSGIGRWWAKSEAYRVDQKKVNDEYVEKMYTYELLVADDMKAIVDYNNGLHPKQKLYPGKTRLQVLLENKNPNMAQINNALIYKCIGEHTETSIRRNQYVTVQYKKYTLPTPEILTKLQTNNYGVDAYYLPNEDGVIDEVFLYQNGVYITKCKAIENYSTAKAEWTPIDVTAYTNQAKYVSEFDKMIKDGKEELATPVIFKKEIMQAAVDTSFETGKTTTESSQINETEQYSFDAERAMDSL